MYKESDRSGSNQTTLIILYLIKLIPNNNIDELTIWCFEAARHSRKVSMAAPHLENNLSSPHRTVCLWCTFCALPVRNGPLPTELKFRENTLAESKTRSRPAVHIIENVGENTGSLYKYGNILKTLDLLL